MTGMFGAMEIAGSGLRATRKWMDAVSDNLANVNTATRTDGEAFRSRMVLARAESYGSPEGVRVTGAALGSREGRLVSDPTHALADADGMVRMPDMDMGEQMTQLIIAQRAYQVNINVIERARDAYTAALSLGRRT
jgi:flagellar basal-body rod protein FlgC